MLNTISCNVSEALAFADAADAMVQKYGWQDMNVYPYSFPIKVTKVISDIRDFPVCTKGSQEYLVSLANGLAKVLNSWEEYELQEKIELQDTSTGTVFKLSKSDEDFIQELVDRGLVIRV